MSNKPFFKIFALFEKNCSYKQAIFTKNLNYFYFIENIISSNPQIPKFLDIQNLISIYDIVFMPDVLAFSLLYFFQILLYFRHSSCEFLEPFRKNFATRASRFIKKNKPILLRRKYFFIEILAFF